MLPYLNYPFLPLCPLKARSCMLSCVRLFNPMDCSPSGSSVRRVFQARILEWVAISFSRESSQPRDGTRHLLHLLHWQADSSAQAPPRKPIHTNSILKYRMVASPTYKAVQMLKGHLYFHMTWLLITMKVVFYKCVLWFMSVFSSRNFIVSGLTFTSLVQFQFIFVYDVTKCSISFFLLCVAVRFFQHCLLKRLSSLHCIFLLPLL